MAEPFIFINTYKIKPGKEEAYKTAHQKVADIVEAKEPKMLYFALHTSEDGSEATTVQVHADAENFGYHMSVVEDHVRAAHEYLDGTSIVIKVLGTPTAEILDQMRQLGGSGVSVTVSPATLGFNRFADC
jgi:hypothetical protein